MNNTITNTIITRRVDGNTLASAEVAATYRANMHDVRVNLLISVNGEKWAVATTYANAADDAAEVANDLAHAHYNYGTCITDVTRKALRESVQAKVNEVVRGTYSTDAASWQTVIASTINTALKLAGNTTTTTDNTAQLAAKDAQLADASAQLAAKDARINELLAQLAAKDTESNGQIEHVVMPDVLAALKAGMSVWLNGQAGTGKSVLAEQLAGKLNAEYFYTGAILDEFAGLKGFIDANGTKHGTEFTRMLDAARAGREVVMCFDEVDGSAPEVLVTLNNYLAGGAVECMGECYRLAANVHIVACGNTTGTGGTDEYVRERIDAATLNRFAFFEVDYDARIELKCANGNDELATFARELRQAAKRCGIALLVTYRDITRLATLADVLAGGKAGALKASVTHSLDVADVATLCAELRQVINGNEWLAALETLAE